MGKTLIAHKLVERLGYSCLSLDHLKMGFIRTGMTELTVEDDYEMRYFLWPFAAEMIKTAIENGQDMIVEGCYIPGEWRDRFEPQYLEHIRCVFIVMSEKYIRTHFDSIRYCAEVIEKRLDDQPDMERLIMCSRDFKADCERYGIDCIEIDSVYDADAMTGRILEICEEA